MFCPNCGTEIKEGYAFCPSCGTSLANKQASLASSKKTSPKSKSVQASTPQPTSATGPVVDVKDIQIKEPTVLKLEEVIDFQKAEQLLEHEGKKIEAFSGFFGKPEPSMVRVEELNMVYEPIHCVKAVYEGNFEVDKVFPITLDPGTTKFTFDGKDYAAEQPKEEKSFFGSGSPSVYQMNLTENVLKKNEKAIYLNLNGVENALIKNFIDGKKTEPFEINSHISGRKKILATNFDASGLRDKVLTPELVTRPLIFKRIIKESILVETNTTYVPKFKVLCKNLKNNQTKYLSFSAADGQVFSTEMF